MRRLLEDFGTLFDLTQMVGAAPLGELLEQALAGFEEPRQDWGTAGEPAKLSTESGRFVSFHYRPHLFPGMDLKLRLAHELQYRLLPQHLPPGSPVSVAAVLESYCHLSGDLFGWEMVDDEKLLIWIADIAGHGVRAGLASAVLRVLLGDLPRPAGIHSFVSRLNRTFHDCILPEHRSLYATLFMMAVDGSGRATYCSAAHPAILVRRPGGGIEALNSLDKPLGMFDDTAYQSRDLQLEDGTCLLMYTDGLVEATGFDDEPFGSRRLRNLLAKSSGDPEELTKAIYHAVSSRQRIDKLEDDVTYLAVTL